MKTEQPKEPVDWFRVVFQGLCGAVIGGIGVGLLVLGGGRYGFSICMRFGWPWPFMLGGAVAGGLLGALRGWGPCIIR